MYYARMMLLGLFSASELPHTRALRPVSALPTRIAFSPFLAFLTSLVAACDATHPSSDLITRLVGSAASSHFGLSLSTDCFGDAVAPRFDRIDTTDGKVAVIRNPAPSVREKRGRQIKDDPKAGRVCIWADEVAQCNRIVLHSALVFALRSC